LIYKFKHRLCVDLEAGQPAKKEIAPSNASALSRALGSGVKLVKHAL
jgi:hypothetical protein